MSANQLADLGVRLGLVAELLDLPAEAGERVEAWMAAVGDDLTGVALELTVAADQLRVAYRLEGDREPTVARLTRFAEDADIDADYLAELDEVCAWFGPERVAAWLEVTRTGMDLGWSIPGPVALEQIWSLPDPGGSRDLLRAACAQREITSASSLGRSLGDGARLTLLELAPGGDDVAAQVNDARRMLRELEVEPLPDRALQGMLSMNDGPARLRIWLAGGEAARAGIAVPQPKTELVLMLRDQVGEDDYEDLALLEGALGEVPRTEAELLRDADGVGLELTYRLR